MRIEPIPYGDPTQYVTRLPRHRLVFLDSAKKDSFLGRFSYLAIDPFDHIVIQSEKISLQKIDTYLNAYRTDPLPDLPPFQGGLAGYFSYELLHFWEKLPVLPKIGIKMPLCQLGCYDLVLSFDHISQKAWIISSGLPETNLMKRQRRADCRLRWLKEKLAQPPIPPMANPTMIETPFTCLSSEKEYLDAVNQIKNYILDGDIFQANIARCYQATIKKNSDIYPLYLQLRLLNPAPFAAFIQFPHCTLLSSSPERFIRISENYIETRPIKGTAPRDPDPVLDQELAEQLKKNTKERAENTMIVDLMRNDLSKVCLPNSIEVPQYCAIESYQTVHHLVSTITGELKPNTHALDILQATFPGGSITGAPKIRAMEIINLLEPIQRGPYCGNIGYLAFNGNMDTSITIRTMIINNTQLYCHAGSAIVLNSDPAKELVETETKIKALKQLIEQITNDFVH